MYILLLGCSHTSRKMNTNAAVVNGSNTTASLEIGEATLDWSEIERTKELMRNNGKHVQLSMPAGSIKSITKKMLFHLIMSSETKKIEDVPLDDFEQILTNMKEEIIFIN